MQVCPYCGHDMVLNNAGPHYFITRTIKAGGQGAVYEVIGDDSKIYAVKEMLDRFDDTKERDEAIARFEAEARLLERLQNPFIPRVYAHFKDEGRYYLAMDLINGEDLEEIVRREGALPEAQVLGWANQICDVLAYLHDSGLIYRDMKPGNVMLEHATGNIKLIDFGIAKVLQPTKRGTQIGTPGYAPPEQYQGIATRESDIFALGATLHHLLTDRDPTNHAPFTFPPARSLNPLVSQRMSDALVRALQMKPEDRFSSVPELRAALNPPVAQPAHVMVTPAAAVQTNPAAAPTPAAAQSAASKQATTSPAASAPAPRVARTQPIAPPAATSAPPAAQQPTQVQSGRVAAAAVAAPAPKAQPQRRNPFVSILIAVVAVVLIGFGLLVAAPSFVPSAPRLFGPTVTPQTLVSQLYVVNDIEIIVPAGTSDQGLLQSFTATFRQAAQSERGANVQLQPDTLIYISGPEQIGQDASGVKYRASLQGTILVPQ
jgi:serine/threonine-protein kinase